MKEKYHPYHIVEIRPWPILAALTAFNTTLIVPLYLTRIRIAPLVITILSIIIVSNLWWRDIIREAKNQGIHQKHVIIGLKIGIIIFITSEIILFTAFFWAFFHSSVRPNCEIGQQWPPIIIKAFNPINIPTLNTVILLSSGVSITWTHHRIIHNNIKTSVLRLKITVMLAIFFTIIQIIEYLQAEFSISDSIFGSTFFIRTGFHGVHVIIGTIFLLVRLTRIKKLHTNKDHYTGIEISIWYWHFVDVIWIFLYTTIYWW